MKKLFFAAAVALLATLSFTSCEEMIVSSDQTIDLLPKATISGNVLAELNLQSTGMEAVPAGTQLLVEVPFSDINPGSVGKWMDTIAVAADGKYTVQVPTDANGVTVSIMPFAFVADQTQPYGSLLNKVTKTYSVTAATTKAISQGQSIILDITYDKLTAAPSYVDKVRISGTFTANINQELAGNDNVPNETVINFYNNSWKDSAIVTNGKYSISVPKGESITVKSKFTASKRVWNLATSSYSNVNYEFKYEDTHTFMAMNDAFNLVAANSGEGTIVSATPNTTAVTGTAKADLDMNFNGLENMPNGTIIKFWTTSTPIWGANVTVTNGQFAVTAPKGQTVYWSTNFKATKKVEMSDPQTGRVYLNEDYEYDMNGSTIFTGDNETYSISAGNGTSVNTNVLIGGRTLVELDDTSVGLELIPSNTLIRFYYANPSIGTTKNIYTTANGTYSLDVPKGRLITYSGTFTAQKRVLGVITNKTFSISGTITADGTKTVDIVAQQLN